MPRPIFQLPSRLRTATRLTALESDLTSETGRAAERHRRIGLAALSSSLASATSFVAALVIVPLVLHHLGSERYGVFATITAIAGLVGWADLGIGNGLINEVASAEGRDDHASVARAVSSAFFALLSVAVVLALLFAVAYPLVPWAAVFNVGGHAARGVGAAAAAFAVGVLLAMPLAVVQRTEIGMQEGFVASAWQALGSLIGLAGVLALVAVNASLPYIVLAVSLAPAIALAGNGLQLFYGRQTRLRPSLRRVDRETVVRLLRTGSLFFVLQLAVAVAYESDALVLAQMLGPRAVTAYSVTMRIFLVVPTLAGFVLAPLWPAYGEAIARGDTEWARRTLRRSVRNGFLLSCGSALILALVARSLIHVWTGFRPSYVLVAAATIWVVVITAGAVLAAFLNGAGVFRAQVVLAVSMMTANLGLSIAFTRWLGVSGVIWGTIVAEGGVVVACMTVVVPRALRQLEGEEPQLSSS